MLRFVPALRVSSRFFSNLSALRFTKEHEWVNPSDAKTASVGISMHAQEALGDVVFVDLPEVYY